MNCLPFSPPNRQWSTVIHNPPASSLVSLAAFLSEFEAPAFNAGDVVAPQPEDGVYQMSYARYEPIVDRFRLEAYRHGWILDFDWMEWTGSLEAKQLRDDEAALSQATPMQLMKLLTVCIRAERFSEGALLDAFHSGLILGIVRRAAALACDRGDRCN